MSSCLECSNHPQTGQFGLCDQCRQERRERVRETLTADVAPDRSATEGQSTLESWGGGS